MKFVAAILKSTSARPPLAKRSILLALALVAIAAMAPRLASACTVEGFVTNQLDQRSPKIAVGQSVVFYVYFNIVVDASNTIQNNSQIGSLKIDFGDGTVQDTGLKTFDPPVTGGWYFPSVPMTSFTHTYAKAGAFPATIKGGRTQPCAIQPGLAPLTVNASPTAVALERKRDAVDRHVLIPGTIAKAEMLLSGPTAYVQIEGSGTCSLKVAEEVGGVALQQYDYSGPLPTKIWISPTAHYVNDPYYSLAYGTHALKIDGSKSSDGCAGTASASWTVQTPHRASPVAAAADRSRTSASPTAALAAAPSPFAAASAAFAKPVSRMQIGAAPLNQPVIQAPVADRSRLQRTDAVSLNPQPLPPATLTAPAQAPSAFR